MTDEELIAAMAAHCDAEGNDRALVRAEQAMSPEERARTEANLQAFLDEGRRTLRRGTPRGDGSI